MHEHIVTRTHNTTTIKPDHALVIQLEAGESVATLVAGEDLMRYFAIKNPETSALIPLELAEPARFTDIEIPPQYMETLPMPSPIRLVCTWEFTGPAEIVVHPSKGNGDTFPAWTILLIGEPDNC